VREHRDRWDRHAVELRGVEHDIGVDVQLVLKPSISSS
jgi:hypothetical protein